MLIYFSFTLAVFLTSGGRFSIKMLSYHNRNFHYKDKMVSRLFNLYNGNPYTGLDSILYWNRPLTSDLSLFYHVSFTACVCVCDHFAVYFFPPCRSSQRTGKLRNNASQCLWHRIHVRIPINYYLQPCFHRKTVFPAIEIPIIKIR